jgi:hypothetical protein
VRDIAARLGDLEPPASTWNPADPPPLGGSDAVDGWLRSLGIDYRAPSDARSTGLPSGFIHAATSTNTLEHVPPEDISSIGRELVRLLDARGAASFQVDYSDHYSHFDSRISPWNFLGITERRWRWINSGLHHQNRLRHSSYRALLGEAGFTIDEEHLVVPDDPQGAARIVRSLPPAPPFDAVGIDDLVVLGATFIVTPRRSD